MKTGGGGGGALAEGAERGVRVDSPWDKTEGLTGLT